MNAKLTFPSRDLAKLFARDYTRKTLVGHAISPDDPQGRVQVTVYEVTEERKAWIESYVANLKSKK